MLSLGKIMLIDFCTGAIVVVVEGTVVVVVVVGGMVVVVVVVLDKITKLLSQVAKTRCQASITSV